MNPPEFHQDASSDEARRDLQMERLVRRPLQVGVLASMVLVLAGLLLFGAVHPSRLTSPESLPALVESGAKFPHTLGDVASAASDLAAEGIIAAGLLVLIATPVLRVALSVVGFAFQHDWVYVGLTALVLLVLLGSFLVGKAG
jgi:uncharacterized membrane protein